jgi:glucokinase
MNSDGMRLEDVASADNIIRRTKIRFHQDHTSSLNRIGEESITIADVVREANNGDDFAQLMLERTGMYVGMAIAGVINLLNIEKIVVGGEIMQAGHYVLDALTRRARELSFEPSFESVEIVEGKLGDKAAAAGVAMLAKLNGE